MKNISEDEVLAEIMRRILTDENVWHRFWGGSGASLEIDGEINLTQAEAEVIERVKG